MKGEFALIHHYFKVRQLFRQPEWLVQGIGDDGAVIKSNNKCFDVVSIDTSVAGVHFFNDDPPADIAYKALASNLSDLAAMGAEPRWFTLALTLPTVSDDWLCAFSRGLFELAEEYRIYLVGGDTTRGPLSITIQVTGSQCHVGLQRSHAQIDDDIYVTNTLGDAALALKVVKGELCVSSEYTATLLERLRRPRPQVKAGLALAAIANAAIDLSDGLLSDLTHICDASQVGAVIDCDQLPLSKAVMSSIRDHRQTIELAIAGGDDYQLCFTAQPARRDEVLAAMKENHIRVTRVGRVIEKGAIDWLFKGDRLNTSHWQGYRHF